MCIRTWASCSTQTPPRMLTQLQTSLWFVTWEGNTGLAKCKNIFLSVLILLYFCRYHLPHLFLCFQRASILLCQHKSYINPELRLHTVTPRTLLLWFGINLSFFSIWYNETQRNSKRSPRLKWAQRLKQGESDNS